ncbi:hypothetical protein ACOSP7_026062 [Xanthoceras sorbifolium]
MVLPDANDSRRLSLDYTTQCIFGGLTFMVVFIFLLMLKYSCSKSKPASSNTSTDVVLDEKPEQANHQTNDVQEFVVIMAGEQNPSHIAKATEI